MNNNLQHSKYWRIDGVLLMFVFLYGISLLPVIQCVENLHKPQQIHLSLGNENEIWVTWTTYDKNDLTYVQYGAVSDGRLEHTVHGSKTTFIDGGSLKRKHYIHRVLLENLSPLTQYKYRCGSNTSWSEVYEFRTVYGQQHYQHQNSTPTEHQSVQYSPRVIIYGDLGLYNGQSITRLKHEVDTHQVDLIFHAGDFAYDLHTNNSYNGDEFMRQMEPIAARVPYQTCPGNHEYSYNFSNYENRFTMFDQIVTKERNNHYYAFHLGPALFVSFSTEFYYFNINEAFAHRQYQWLESVLAYANKPENRAAHPWIITVGHRPMYCSNTDHDDCTNFKSKIRKGFQKNKTELYGLEDLFHKYGVDLEIWAHEHSYERLWPVYDTKVLNGTTRKAEPYTNPPAPVHVTTGSAGCREFIDHFIPHPRPWSAFRDSEYGYAKMHILNSTHLTFEQVNETGKAIDKFVLIQEHHRMRTL